MGRRRLDRKSGSTAIQHKERHRQSGVGASCGKVVVLGAQKEEGVEATKPSNSKVNLFLGRPIPSADSSTRLVNEVALP